MRITKLFLMDGFWRNDERVAKEIDKLLDHTMALEAMLKKHEWSGEESGWETCLECHGFKANAHAPDCQLAKLLEGVEP